MTGDVGTKSSLEGLGTQLLAFGREWRERTGRPLDTVRDGIDFLAAMRARDDFWLAVAPGDPALDTTALRAALPPGGLPADVEPEGYLRTLGLEDEEIRALVDGLDAAELFDGAIRDAFAQPSPQKVARALERVLDCDPDVVATERYVERLPRARGLGRSLGVLVGTAVLLVGTMLAACGPSSAPGAPGPASGASQRAEPQPEPAPAPVPPPAPPPPSAQPRSGVEPTTPTPEPSPPEPVPTEASPDPPSEPAPQPAPARRPRRPRPPPATAAYKGVSPRRRRPRRDPAAGR